MNEWPAAYPTDDPPDDWDPDAAADATAIEMEKSIPPFTNGTAHEKDFASWAIVRRQAHLRDDHHSLRFEHGDPYAHQSDHVYLYVEMGLAPQGHPVEQIGDDEGRKVIDKFLRRVDWPPP